MLADPVEVLLDLLLFGDVFSGAPMLLLLTSVHVVVASVVVHRVRILLVMVLLVTSVPFAVTTTAIVVAAAVVAPVILEALLVLVVGLALILVGLDLGLSASQVDCSAIDVGLLHVLDQVLRDRLILKRDEAKATARIRVGVLDDLNFFDDAVLAEKAIQLILRQVVVQPADEYLVASASARTNLASRSGLLLVLVLGALAVTSPLSAPIATPTTLALTIAPASLPVPLTLLVGLLLGRLVRLLGTQKTICRFVAVALPNLYVAAAD